MSLSAPLALQNGRSYFEDFLLRALFRQSWVGLEPKSGFLVRCMSFKSFLKLSSLKRRDAVAASGLQHSLVGGMLLATFTDSLHK